MSVAIVENMTVEYNDRKFNVVRKISEVDCCFGPLAPTKPVIQFVSYMEMVWQYENREDDRGGDRKFDVVWKIREVDCCFNPLAPTKLGIQYIIWFVRGNGSTIQKHNGGRWTHVTVYGPAVWFWHAMIILCVGCGDGLCLLWCVRIQNSAKG